MRYFMFTRVTFVVVTRIGSYNILRCFYVDYSLPFSARSLACGECRIDLGGRGSIHLADRLTKSTFLRRAGLAFEFRHNRHRPGFTDRDYGQSKIRARIVAYVTQLLWIPSLWIGRTLVNTQQTLICDGDCVSRSH